MPLRSPLIYIICLLFLLLLAVNLFIVQKQQYVLLAQSFLQGVLSTANPPYNGSDYALFEGKYFWPLGPFPAVILIPFVFIFQNFRQSFIQFPLNVLNFFLLFKIARRLDLTPHRALLLATFFIFGSIYTQNAAIPGSWYYAHIVATTLILLAILEFLGKKRYLLIGLLIGLATTTRFTLIFTSVFFLFDLLKRPVNAKNVLKFTLPIVSALFILGIYNYLRFHNFLESGYNLQLIYWQAELRRNEGLFSLKHIPVNIYYMLFAGPQPVLDGPSHILKPPYIKYEAHGLSMFFLSPILFLLFKAKLSEKIVKYSLATIAVMLVPILTYYGIGYEQVGYRYALDFFPFVFLILAPAVKTSSLKILYLLVFFGVIVTWLFTFQMLFGLS